MPIGLRAVVLLFLALFSSFPSIATEIQFGSLVLNWPEGFTSPSNKPPFQLIGPNGEVVLVTTMRQRKEPAAPGDSVEQAKMAEVGEKFIRRKAEEVGTVVRSTEHSKLTDGTLLYTIGSKTSSVFGAGFFLQYFLVSPVGRLAFITIEGKGDALAEQTKYLGAVSTARWLE